MSSQQWFGAASSTSVAQVWRGGRPPPVEARGPLALYWGGHFPRSANMVPFPGGLSLRSPPLQEVTMQPPLMTSVPVAPWLHCGLDEVGRGALAGPLVAAAVILPEDIAERLGPLARFLRDSKTVARARREEIAEQIRRHALAHALVTIPVEDINVRGIGWANGEAFRRLIATVEATEYVV